MESSILTHIHQKYEALDQDPQVHLEGLLWSRPITYWDYIQTDALLALQTQRTSLPDEMVFIMYHQVNELLFKMILWEIEQVAKHEALTTEFFASRLMRISRYFDMLSESFNIMGDGMEVAQYMKFRNTLTPASGFQSAQYRMIEFCSTEVINLVDVRFRASMPSEATHEHLFEHLYWQAAGKDHQTGKKSLLMRLFEEKYKGSFIRKMKEYDRINLWSRFKSLPKAERENTALLNAMRHYDHTVNVSWVMAHYWAAEKYLDSGEESAEATGGSDWKKYMHPRYQRRIFFPDLWSQEELDQWGIHNLTAYHILDE